MPESYPYRDFAHEMVEAVCNELGTSLRHYMPTTKERALAKAEQLLRQFHEADHA